MNATWSTTDTPAGPFSAVLDDDGAVLASGWTAELDALLPQVHPTLRPAEVVWVDDLGKVTTAVRDYHRGEHRVLRVGGALGGFRWGTGIKGWLLDHESGENTAVR